MVDSKLIERIEEASGPDRELDAEILWHIRRDRFSRLYWTASLGRPQPLDEMPRSGLGWVSVTRYAPLYTKSIDDVMTLIADDAFWRLGHDGEGPDPSLFKAEVLRPSLHRLPYTAVAATPALALVAAALRSRSSS